MRPRLLLAALVGAAACAGPAHAAEFLPAESRGIDVAAHDVAMGPGGNTLLAWHVSGRAEPTRWVYRTAGETFEPARTGPPGTHPSAAVGRDGRAILAWSADDPAVRNDYAIEQRYRRPDGTWTSARAERIWRAEARISDGGWGTVLGCGTTSPNSAWEVPATPDGEFGAPRRRFVTYADYTLTTYGCTRTRLDVAPNNHAAAVVDEEENTNWTERLESTWVEDRRPPESQGVVVAGSDTVLQAWRTAAPHQVVARWAGSGAAPPVELSDPALPSGEPEADMSPDGAAIVVWVSCTLESCDPARRHVWARRISPGSVGPPARLTSVAGDVGTFTQPVVAVGRNGAALAAWSITVEGVERVQGAAAPPGGAFGPTVELGTGSGPRVAIDAGSRGIVAWRGAHGRLHSRDVVGITPVAEPVATAPATADPPLSPPSTGEPIAQPLASLGPLGPPTAASPVLSRLRLRPSLLRSGRAGKISFSSTSATTVELQVSRKTVGHRSGRRCVPGRRRAPAKACPRWERVRTFSAEAVAGTNTVALRARQKGQALRAGAYRLEASPVNGALRGTAVVALFRVARKG